MKRYRPRLPERPLAGRFMIAEAALEEAERLLPTYRGPDGDHEGLVFLCGLELGDVTVLLSAIAPDCDHGPGHVMCSIECVASVAQAARSAGLGVLAQVHSHPTGHMEHSLGDDQLVLMPFEGMLSIVAEHYGRHGLRPLHHAGVHQHRSSGWVRVSPESIRRQITVVPGAIDLR